jgi:hypothetical protein
VQREVRILSLALLGLGLHDLPLAGTEPFVAQPRRSVVERRLLSQDEELRLSKQWPWQGDGEQFIVDP